MFFQNGSWEYGNLTGEGKYTDDDLAMIPIYIGVGDEANQGLCTGTENYWCVNKEASEDDIQATLDFITGASPPSRAPRPWPTTWALSSRSKPRRIPEPCS